MNNLIKSVKKHEGFRSEVYKDSLGFDTIGYGTKMPLSEFEAELILRHRLDAKIEELVNEKQIVLALPSDKQFILYEMAYQLGVSGLVKFKKMWIALESKDYFAASEEMLDSRWAKQTPRRANELAFKMKS